MKRFTIFISPANEKKLSEHCRRVGQTKTEIMNEAFNLYKHLVLKKKEKDIAENGIHRGRC